MLYVNEEMIIQDQFPDHTLLVKFDPTGLTNVTISWYYESDSELFTLICLKRHLDQHNIKCKLYMPYVPHARMDRVKAPGDVFTLKYFCEVINSLNFIEVKILDVHSNVTPALLERVIQMDVMPIIDAALDKFDRGNTAIYFPDEGAMKRYADNLGDAYPIAFGIKQRDWATGAIKGVQVMNPENIVGKDVLIIDDICSYGGTFYHSAKALKAAGAKTVSLYVTHCENNIEGGRIFDNPELIDKIYTTGTLNHTENVADRVYYV